MWYAFAPDH